MTSGKGCGTGLATWFAWLDRRAGLTSNGVWQDRKTWRGGYRTTKRHDCWGHTDRGQTFAEGEVEDASVQEQRKQEVQSWERKKEEKPGRRRRYLAWQSYQPAPLLTLSNPTAADDFGRQIRRHPSLLPYAVSTYPRDHDFALSISRSLLQGKCNSDLSRVGRDQCHIFQRRVSHRKSGGSQQVTTAQAGACMKEGGNRESPQKSAGAY